MEGNGMKRVLRILGYYTWIPLAASILGCIPGLLGAPTYVDAIAVPLFAVIKRLCEKGFSFLEQRKNKKKETLPDPDEEGGDAE